MPFGLRAWMVVVIVGRELLVTALRSFMEERGSDFSAKMSGKLKMVFQCAAGAGLDQSALGWRSVGSGIAVLVAGFGGHCDLGFDSFHAPVGLVVCGRRERNAGRPPVN